MISELIYTSAPSGLRPGAKGFCTVAATKGLTDTWIKQFEGMTGYRHNASAGAAVGNPTNWMHLIANNGQSILARVCDAGLDYTKRTNKLAHFALLESADRSSHGPTGMLFAPGNFFQQWVGDARTLPHREFQSQPIASGVCTAWKRATGDAGWAGVLAENATQKSGKDIYVVCNPDTNAIEMIVEALSLLGQAERWQVSFSTYFIANCTNGLKCRWRFILKDSKEHVELQRLAGVEVIDATAHQPLSHQSAWIEAARTGIRNQPAVTPNTIAKKESSVFKPLGKPSAKSEAVQQPAFATQDAYTLQAIDLGAALGPPSTDSFHNHRQVRQEKSQPFPLVAVIAASLIALVLGGTLGGGGMHWYRSRDQTVASLELDKSKLEKERDKLKDELDGSKKTSNTSASEKAKLDATVASLNTQLGKQKTEIADRDAKIKDLETKKNTPPPFSETPLQETTAPSSNLPKIAASTDSAGIEIEKGDQTVDAPKDFDTEHPNALVLRMVSDEHRIPKSEVGSIEGGEFGVLSFVENKLSKSDEWKSLLYKDNQFLSGRSGGLGTTPPVFAKILKKEIKPEKLWTDKLILKLKGKDSKQSMLLMNLPRPAIARDFAFSLPNGLDGKTLKGVEIKLDKWEDVEPTLPATATASPATTTTTSSPTTSTGTQQPGQQSQTVWEWKINTTDGKIHTIKVEWTDTKLEVTHTDTPGGTKTIDKSKLVVEPFVAWVLIPKITDEDDQPQPLKIKFEFTLSSQ